MTTRRPANAGVNFPPPLVYLLGIAAAWLLNRWRPLSITAGPSSARFDLGVLGVFVWLVLFVSALREFNRSHTTFLPNEAATAFVTSGPYRFSRNPMYVSMVALYLGLTCFINTWWGLIVLPVVVLIIQRMVIIREERYLSQAFPEEYAAYRRRVRRWL